VLDDRDDVAIAAITAAELLVGVELASPARRAARSEFVEGVLETFVVEGFDLEVARAHSALLADTQRAGRPRGAHDLIVAATARATEREVVSSDASGFAGLPGVALRVC
jgi:tRNA(fMet)-specific endonuclease VapC